LRFQRPQCNGRGQNPVCAFVQWEAALLGRKPKFTTQDLGVDNIASWCGAVCA
jgi:hypothetical protein